MIRASLLLSSSLILSLALFGACSDNAPSPSTSDAGVTDSGVSPVTNDAATVDGGNVLDASSSDGGATAIIQSKWDALASSHGCTKSTVKVFPAVCASLAIDYLNCIATDAAQCACEKGSNKLNCEGSYKADEGPAKCVASHDALNECLLKNP